MLMGFPGNPMGRGIPIWFIMKMGCKWDKAAGMGVAHI